MAVELEEYFSSPRKIDYQKKGFRYRKWTPSTGVGPQKRVPPPVGGLGGRLRRLWSEHCHQPSGVQAFYGEYIFTGYPTNVEVERIAGKL